MQHRQELEGQTVKYQGQEILTDNGDKRSFLNIVSCISHIVTVIGAAYLLTTESIEARRPRRSNGLSQMIYLYSRRCFLTE